MKIHNIKIYSVNIGTFLCHYISLALLAIFIFYNIFIVATFASSSQPADLYREVTPELLNIYDPNNNSLRLSCEYYKSQANNYCIDSHSSNFNERERCVMVYKQRWCVCMGKNHDCFVTNYFYW